MNLENAYKEAVEELGYDLNDIYKVDNENTTHQVKNANNNTLDNQNPYNTNLYDMAESLIDSLATLELPAWGYGLRYKFGNLRQYHKSLKQQAYHPSGDINLKSKQSHQHNTHHSEASHKKDFSKNPLEIQRFDFSIKIQLEGRVEQENVVTNGLSVSKNKWVDTKMVKAQAWDSQVAGYNTFNTVSVRLWSALPIFANEMNQNSNDIIDLLDQRRKQANNNANISTEYDHYRNIIEIRKECEKITCAPYPKDPS